MDKPTQAPDETAFRLVVTDDGDELGDEERTQLHQALDESWTAAQAGQTRLVQRRLDLSFRSPDLFSAQIREKTVQKQRSAAFNKLTRRSHWATVRNCRTTLLRGGVMRNTAKATLGPFTVREASILGEVPYKTVYYWNSSDFISPSIKEPTSRHEIEHQILYGFADVVSIRTVSELRSAGLYRPTLEKIVAYLKTKNIENPSADAKLVATYDGDVIELVPPSKASSIKNRAGKYVFYEVNFGALVKDLRERASKEILDPKKTWKRTWRGRQRQQRA